MADSPDEGKPHPRFGTKGYGFVRVFEELPEEVDGIMLDLRGDLCALRLSEQQYGEAQNRYSSTPDLPSVQIGTFIYVLFRCDGLQSDSCGFTVCRVLSAAATHDYRGLQSWLGLSVSRSR